MKCDKTFYKIELVTKKGDDKWNEKKTAIRQFTKSIAMEFILKYEHMIFFTKNKCFA